MADPKKADPFANAAPTQASTAASSRTPDPYGVGQDWLSESIDVGGIPGLQPESTHTSHYGQDPADKSTYGTLIGGTQPLSDVMKSFGSLRGANLAQIQQALYLGGFYTGNYTPTLGVLHNQDLDAFRESLKIASQAGGNLAQFLGEAAKAGQEQGTKTQHNYEQLTHVLHTTDPNRVSQTIEAAFSDALGRGPSKEEKARFVASFRARETAYQQQQFSAEDAARQAYINRDVSGADYSGAVSQTVGSEAPDLTADATAEARQDYPGEYGAHKIAAVGQEFFNMIRGA